MESVNITNARQELFSLAEKTIQTSTPLKITTKKGSVIMLSESDYDALQETVYLLSMPGMREDLLTGLNEPVEECATLEDLSWDTK